MAAEQGKISLAEKERSDPPPYHTPADNPAYPSPLWHVNTFLQQNQHGFYNQPYQPEIHTTAQKGLTNNGNNQPSQVNMNQSNVIITQPQSPAVIMVDKAPDSNIVFAILSCFFCCWITGLIAIVFSFLSMDSSSRQDYEKALSRSTVSKILSGISLAVGTTAYVSILVKIFV